MGLNVETCVFSLWINEVMKLSFFEVDVKSVEHHLRIFHGHLPRVYSAAWIILALGGLQSPGSKFARSMRATPH